MREERTHQGGWIMNGSLLLPPLIFLLHNINFYRGLLLYKDVYWLAAGYLLLPVLLFVLFRFVFRQRKALAVLIALLWSMVNWWERGDSIQKVLLAATLNLNYLQLDQKALVRDFKNYLLGAEVYKSNPVFSFFAGQGYKVSHFSILDNYNHLDQLGTFVPKTPFYSLRNQTLERIFLNPWLWLKAAGASEQAIPASVKESLRYYGQYNRQALDHVLQPAANRQFSFTHFLLPHEPYVFSKPSVDSLQLIDLMDYQHGYIEQVKYANRLIMQLVAELKKNKRNIIILQGDHGFRDYDPARYPKLTQNETLNAFYFPDGRYEVLYDSISPVNTYRLVLNQYFGQKLPLIRDEHFVPAE